MKTITINLYKFEELSPEAQERTIEANRDINTDFDHWHDWLLDDWKEKLEALGYEDVEINYSGFWSQGDGASFPTENIDLWKWLKAHKLATKYRSLKKYIDEEAITCQLTRITHHYYHENTVVADMGVESEVPDKAEAKARELEKLIDEQTEDYARELYKALSDSFDYLSSDESVKETIIANEYDFLAEGGKIQ